VDAAAATGSYAISLADAVGASSVVRFEI